MIIPSIDSSFRFFSQTSAIFFQSSGPMSSENFMNGDSIFMLAMVFISGAMFRISSESVEITAPDFGSSLDEIVPPSIIIAMFGSFLFCSCSNSFFSAGFTFSKIDASRISFSLIPMLYPDFSFNRIISGSCDWSAWPSHVRLFVCIFTLSPGVKVFVFI